VAGEPPRHGSNKVVSLSLNWHQPGSLPARFQVYYANGCGFAYDLGALCFHKVTACTFHSWD